jgi:flavin reductase (DIM6/NTAB) family NADH-FMN oxidoreductase RutF
MYIDFGDLDSREIYKTMIQMVIPRPIAWVLSINSSGSYNLAPFSYFNIVGSNPPMISMSIGCKQDGELKDTWRNIEAREFFTVHIPQIEHAQLVTDSAKPLPAEESEVTALGLKTIGSDSFPVPRLENCKAAFFCRKEKIIELGNGPQGMIIGRVQGVYIDSACATTDEGQVKIDPLLLNPLARLGGNDYCELGRVFTITPSVEK